MESGEWLSCSLARPTNKPRSHFLAAPSPQQAPWSGLLPVGGEPGQARTGPGQALGMGGDEQVTHFQPSIGHFETVNIRGGLLEVSLAQEVKPRRGGTRYPRGGQERGLRRRWPDQEPCMHVISRCGGGSVERA